MSLAEIFPRVAKPIADRYSKACFPWCLPVALTPDARHERPRAASATAPSALRGSACHARKPPSLRRGRTSTPPQPQDLPEAALSQGEAHAQVAWQARAGALGGL